MILALSELEERFRARRLTGDRIVLAIGCFDVLHVGHIGHLQAARELGDALVVACTSDATADRELTFGQDDRAKALAALRCVSFVVIDDLPPPSLDLFYRLRPDVFVKGTDYLGNINPQLKRQKEAVEALGGRFVIVGDKLSGSRRLAHQPPKEYVNIYSLSTGGVYGDGLM